MAAMSGHTAARPMSLVDCYVITEFWFSFFFLLELLAWLVFFGGVFFFKFCFSRLGVSPWSNDTASRRRDRPFWCRRGLIPFASRRSKDTRVKKKEQKEKRKKRKNKTTLDPRSKEWTEDQAKRKRLNKTKQNKTKTRVVKKRETIRIRVLLGFLTEFFFQAKPHRRNRIVRPFAIHRRKRNIDLF